MIIGLLISAMIGNADRGMPLLVLVVMAELVLCGGMFGVRGRFALGVSSVAVAVAVGLRDGRFDHRSQPSSLRGGRGRGSDVGSQGR